MFKARAEVAVLQLDYSKQAVVLIHISIFFFWQYGEWSNIQVAGGGEHRQTASNMLL